MDMEKARTMKEAISRFRFPGSRAVFDGYGAASCQKAPRIRGYQKESECSINGSRRAKIDDRKDRERNM